MDLSDEELIQGVQRGSEENFRALYDKYKAPLFNYLYRFLGDKQTAEDSLQDVFIRVHQKANMYKPTAKLSSWLYKIAKNAAFDALRKIKTRKASSFEAPIDSAEPEASLGDFIKSTSADPRTQSVSNELAGLVHGAIARLNDGDRELVVLCDIQELSHKEVGEILGFSAGTIAVKLYRVRQKLAEILKIEGDF